MKAGMPNSFKPKDVLKFGTPKEDIKRQKNIWAATFKPQPAEQQVPVGPSGPVTGAMSEEEQDDIRKRQAQRSRPQTTALSAGQSNSLGG